MTAKYGTPYFSNYINSDMEPSDVRSMCCRLRWICVSCAKIRRLFRLRRKHGLVGVVTINIRGLLTCQRMRRISTTAWIT